MTNQKCTVFFKISRLGLINNTKTISEDNSVCKQTHIALIKIKQFPKPENEKIYKQIKEIQLTITATENEI